jgi:hypothetical protein
MYKFLWVIVSLKMANTCPAISWHSWFVFGGLWLHIWAQRPAIVPESFFVVFLEENSGGTWTGIMCEDRDEWWAVVNTLMNLRVP